MGDTDEILVLHTTSEALCGLSLFHDKKALRAAVSSPNFLKDGRDFNTGSQKQAIALD